MFALYRLPRSKSRRVNHVAYNRKAAAGTALTPGPFVPLLPLFPLDVVLFPGTPLPLHIFEPRYKEMISECLASQTVFGVVRALEQGIAEIGCTAEIVAVTKKYPDGRLDLVTEGRERFEVVEVNQDRAFLQAEIIRIPNETDAAAKKDVARAIDLHRQILALAGASPDIPDTAPVALSFHLAGSLPLDLDFKQKLLATRSEGQRILALASHLETILPALRRAARAREKAGGNGHVH